MIKNLVKIVFLMRKSVDRRDNSTHIIISNFKR